ncbi:MAG: hypothetical protein NTX86_01190 [Candidatus Dependentiae bacterium]|nr:hypothetical protein [Candidatus Dependentiae bacterium]
MKKILLLIALSCNSYTQNTFECVSYKTHGHLDTIFLQNMVNTFNVDNFFETGTFDAGTTINAVPYFKTIVTVELHDSLFAGSKAKLAPYKNVIPFHGHSPEAIRIFAPQLQGTILFWLDAHYSGEGTALSFSNHEAPDAVTPIRGELAAIKAANLNDCVILIDDIRGFGIEVAGVEYLGCWAYPSVQELKRDLLAINPNFTVMLLGDMLLAYDQSKHQPLFSDTVQACTKTRLYDGYNLSNEELLAAEEVIQHAPEKEKSCLKNLYKLMTHHKDPMFWHDLWYGLVELGDGNYAHAHSAFSKVALRTQTFNKNRQYNLKTIAYNHRRIDTYLNACK